MTRITVRGGVEVRPNEKIHILIFRNNSIARFCNRNRTVYYDSMYRQQTATGDESEFCTLCLRRYKKWRHENGFVIPLEEREG